jgi:hypothetical protein|nr:hypothetical protein [uncultured Leptotrichia sp.]
MSHFIAVINDSSLIMKSIFLAAILLHMFIIFKAARRKANEGITKGRIWITYAVIYWVAGLIGGMVISLLVILILQGIFAILNFLNYAHIDESTIFMIGYSLHAVANAIIFAILNKRYLTSEKNIGREEATDTKQYILLLLKLIGIGILAFFGLLFAIPIILFAVAAYVVFKFLSITGFVAGMASNRIQEVQDDIDMAAYKRQQYGVHNRNERIISDSEAQQIKERMDNRNKKF